MLDERTKDLDEAAANAGIAPAEQPAQAESEGERMEREEREDLAQRKRMRQESWQRLKRFLTRQGVEDLLGHTAFKVVIGLLGGVMFVIGLGLFGAFDRLRALVTSLSGDGGSIVVCLAGGAVLIAVAALNRRLATLPVVSSLQWGGVIVAYLLVAWLILTNAKLFNNQVESPVSDEARRLQGIALGVATVVFLLLVVTLVARTAVITAALSPTKTSTAPTVIVLWSAVVVYAIAFIAVVALTSERPLECDPSGDNPATAVIETAITENCVEPGVWPDYLLLLGLPGVAAAIAKSREVDGSGNPIDEATDAPGSATSDTLTEVQFFVFNAIAMIFVIWSLAAKGVLGEVPDVVLGLTGASALTFSLAKRLPAVERKT